MLDSSVFLSLQESFHTQTVSTDSEVLDKLKQCPDFRGSAMDSHKGASQCAHAERCQAPVRSKPVSLSETALMKWGSVFKFSSLSLSDQFGLWSYYHHP